MSKQKTFNRVVFILLVLLALAVGYFQTALENTERKYKRLEDRFVRLEMMIGASESAQLIEDSYQIIDNQGQIIKD
jgi:uncharacterized protein HemX